MPRITEVNSQSVKIKAPTKGGLLSRAVPVAEMTARHIKLVIYGQNRTGKTTLACQFPKPLLLISLEPAESGGASSVRKVPGIDFIHIQKGAQADELAAELEGNTHYATHVLDGCTNLERMHLAEVLGVDELTEQLGRTSHGGISREQYTERSERFKNSINKFRKLKAHTIVICREKDHSPPRDQFQPRMMRRFEPESFFASDLGGGSVGWLHDAFDYIGQLIMEKEVTTKKIKFQGKDVDKEIETGRYIRRLRSVYHPNYAAGFRSDDPSRIPPFIDGSTPQEMYENIMAVIGMEEK